MKVDIPSELKEFPRKQLIPPAAGIEQLMVGEFARF
jgi:hypothetical protein